MCVCVCVRLFVCVFALLALAPFFFVCVCVCVVVRANMANGVLRKTGMDETCVFLCGINKIQLWAWSS